MALAQGPRFDNPRQDRTASCLRDKATAQRCGPHRGTWATVVQKILGTPTAEENCKRGSKAAPQAALKKSIQLEEDDAPTPERELSSFCPPQRPPSLGSRFQDKAVAQPTGKALR